ncbi:MAG: DUF3617 domain-containing protein [Nitrospira sp.]|nr:DUF3617 domain-containing protein [Nitrospira sp.]
MNKTRWKLTHMITLLGITVICNPFLLAPTPDVHAESFNIKPGAWEMSVTTVTSGMKLSPELSAKMAPAQRAHMEQMMKAREGKPQTRNAQACITKEDLSQDRIIKEMEDEDEDTAVQCKVKILSKSSTKLVLDQLCPGPPSATTHFTIEAKSAESFAAVGDRQETGSGKSHIDIKGKWVSASCDGLDE